MLSRRLGGRHLASSERAIRTGGKRKAFMIGAKHTRDEKNQRVLSNEPLMSDLGRRTASGGLIAVGVQSLRMSISLLYLFAMARLLAPTDFGLVAMASTVTAFITLFSDLGLSTATVQRKNLSQDVVTTLFHINVFLGVGVMLAAIAVAPLAAWGFDDDRVRQLVVALAIPIPLVAAASQHNALLQRGMRWRALQGSALATQVSGMVAGIFLAWKTDLGYWSLVGQAWVSAIIGLVIVWGLCPWRPSWSTNWRSSRSVLNFGLNLSAFNVVNYFHRQFDNLLIGWRWGAAELGFYTRAYALLTLPLSLINGPLGSAVIPALSRLQGDPERWERSFLDAFGALMLLSCGMTALMITTANPLVAFLFGAEWSEVGRIFSILCISNFGAAAMNAMGWIYISLGRTRRMLLWSLIISPVYVLSFILGVSFGPAGVALAYSFITCLAVIPCVAFATKGTPIDTKVVVKIMSSPVLAGILSTIIGLKFLGGNSSSAPIAFLETGAITFSVYLSCTALIMKFDHFYANVQRRVMGWIITA